MIIAGHTLTYYYQGLIVPLSILIPITVAAIYYKYLCRAVHILLLYLLASGIINLTAIIQSSTNNHPLLHLYTIVEFVLLMIYFRRIDKGTSLQRLSNMLLVFFPLLCIINVLFFQSQYSFNTYVRPIEALIFIVYSLRFFIISANIENEESWSSGSLNWINSGLLLYFSSSLFLFIFSNTISIRLSHDVKMVIWNIHDSFVLILYLLMAYGFSKCKPSQKTSIS